MNFDLVVLSPFSKYQKGARITDDKEIEEIIKANMDHNTIRVAKEG